MIDPKLLTEKNGFAIGTVVETVRMDDGIPIPVYGQLTETVLELIREFPDYIVSIRPLTGTMAIWNLKPPKATHLAIVEGEQFCWWEPDDVVFEEWERVWIDYGARIEIAPFWAEVKR